MVRKNTVTWTEDENHILLDNGISPNYSLVKVSKYTLEDKKKLLMRYSWDDSENFISKALYKKYPDVEKYHDTLEGERWESARSHFVRKHTGVKIRNLEDIAEEMKKYNDVPDVLISGAKYEPCEDDSDSDGDDGDDSDSDGDDWDMLKLIGMLDKTRLADMMSKTQITDMMTHFKNLKK